MKLENKVAFLTGCGKGIGKRVAHRFGKEGAKCIFTGRNYSDIKEVAEEIKKMEVKQLNLSWIYQI